MSKYTFCEAKDLNKFNEFSENNGGSIYQLKILSYPPYFVNETVDLIIGFRIHPFFDKK